MEGDMKKTLIVGLAILISFLFIEAKPGSELPAADAQALWKYISEVSPYQDWGFWEDHADMQPGNAPMAPSTRFS